MNKEKKRIKIKSFFFLEKKKFEFIIYPESKYPIKQSKSNTHLARENGTLLGICGSWQGGC